MKATRLTLTRAAAELGIDRATLRKNLIREGITIPRGTGATVTLRQVVTAMVGDPQRERTLKTQAERKLLEQELATRTGTLVEMAAVEVLIRDGMLPISQRLKALASDAAHLANPTDPQLARDALQRWVDQSLPLIRAGMPKLMKETKS